MGLKWGSALFRGLRALAQPFTYLGLTTIILIVIGLFYLTEKDRTDAEDRAKQAGTNLARVFEGLMARTFKNADNTLLILRELYQRDRAHFDLVAWGRHAAIRNELTMQFSIVDKNGVIRNSSRGPSAIGVYVGDREHFRSQVHASGDDLAISKPVELRTHQRWGIIISRRILAADGSFDGIITASLDPYEFRKFFSALDLGPGGVVSLVGFDGVIRARGDGAKGGIHASAFGVSVSGARALKEFRHSPAGTYWNTPGTVDRVKRLVSYRVVEGFPLIAAVGSAESEVFKFARENIQIYYLLATIAIMVILIAIGLAAIRQDRLLAAAATLAQTNLQFDTALDNMPHGLSMFDRAQRLVVCNDRYIEMYRLNPAIAEPGTSVETILRARAAEHNDRSDRERYVRERLEHIGKNQAGTIIDEQLDGRMIAITHQPMPNGGWVAIHADITAEKRAEAEIAQLAHYDPLTNVANRTLFQKHLAQAMDRLHHEDTPFALLLLDLDHFKAVNDSLGHAVGDYLVASVADRLKTCVGEAGTVARLGGDEFAILLEADIDQASEAVALARRILETVGEPYELDGHRVIVEGSIGIALAPAHGVDVKHLLKNADLALYKAKSEGRNSYCFFEASMDMAAQSRYVIEAELRTSIPRGEFELHYQPIVSADGRTVCAMEALARWPHPTRGYIGPDTFIPVAEATGLIVPFGDWVLRKACSEAMTWPEHIKVAVNLSPVQFRKGDIVATVRDALRESGLAPQRLELEITESVLLQKDDANLSILHQLHNLGIAIALDDFGTGYSSLSYLKVFPFDKIKIDRSFIREMTTRIDCAAIVGAVAGLARSLGIVTTAEGVETREQHELLRAAGCTQAQGFLFGHPRPSAALSFGAATEWNDRAAGAA
jgi:diguanylate cyclase (GGDEF)-like protein